jgi:tripartite-type tricarboxylate transporter receptor subunit TctC
MKKFFLHGLAVSFLFVMVVFSFGAPRVEADETNFYEGKTVTLTIGFTPGGFYDRWSRHFARYMPKFIPGNPQMIVQNMPAAGSRVAANYLYNVAKADGLNFGTINKGLYFDQLVGNKLAQFDWRKYSWVGSPEQPPDVLYIRTDSNVATLDDAKNIKRALKCGSTGRANTGYILPKAIEQVLGIKFDIVLGYRGGREVDLAVERKEVECRSMSIPPFLGREPFLTWKKNNIVLGLVQTGKGPFAGAPEIPSLFDVLKKHNVAAEDVKFLELITASSEFGRPFVGPPGIPQDRLNILRKAFQAVLVDTEAQDEAKRINLDADPVKGEKLQAMAVEVIDASPANVKRLKSLLGAK